MKLNLSMAFFISGTIIILFQAQAQVSFDPSCNNVSYEGRAYVPERLIASMDRIAVAYCEKQAHDAIIVTSGVRTPEQQAKLMLNCLQKSACDYYANSAAAAEIQAAYDEANANEKAAAVTAKIQQQINRVEPCYISKHLTAFALDIERHTNGDSGNCRADLIGDDLILAQILQSSEDVSNITYKESSGCTHFHVNFVGWDKLEGLRQCPQSNSEPTADHDKTNSR